MSEEQIKLLRNALERSNVWGIIVGDSGWMSRQLYKHVFKKMPTGITHVGMTVSKDKAHKQRYAHIKAACAKHRVAQSRGLRKHTEKSAEGLSERRYLWGTTRHPHQTLSLPARPVAEADNCIHTLRTSQQ